MKINKIISKALLALVTVMGFASCSSDDIDVTTPKPTNAQVYFSKLGPTAFLLEENQNAVQIEVKRMKTEGSFDAKIEATDNSGLFNIPSVVNFADGSDTATLNISFNFSALTADTSYPIELKIADEASEYGESKRSIIIRYAPWSDWEPWGWSYPGGVSNYTDWTAAYAKFADGGYEDMSIIVNGDLPTYGYAQYMSGVYDQPVFYRESLLNPSNAQLLLVDWFYGVDLTIDWNKATNTFTIQPQLTGYHNSSYDEDVYVADSYTYWHDIRGKEDVTAESYPCSFDAANGTLTLNVSYYISLGCFGTGDEIIQLPGYTKPDYSVAVSDEGSFQNAKNKLGEVFYFALGADVTTVKYAVFEGNLAGEDMEKAEQAVLNDEVETYSTSESGYKVVMVDGEGDYTLVVLNLDANGKKVDSTSFLTFTVKAPVPGATWTPIYVGDFVYTLFFATADDPYTDEGLVLYQCDSDPTLFKIEHWGYDVDFVFNMDDEGKVFVNTGSTGVVDEQYGEVMVCDQSSVYGEEAESSYYADGVFHFNIIYFVEAGFFGKGFETFTLTGTAQAAIARAKAFARAKKSLDIGAETVQPFDKVRAISRNANKKANIESYLYGRNIK